MTTRSLASKILLTTMAVGFTGSVAAVGTHATFTGTDSESHTLATGTVAVGLAATGSDNRLATGATGIVPGDTIQRTASITNSGSEDLASVTLTAAASTSSLLDTDTTDGLQITVDRCSVAWTESGPPYTYTCGGTTDSILAQTPVVMASQDLSLVNTLNSLTAAGTDHLRITLELPSSADNTFQNLSSTIDYTFTGTQRAATDK